MPLGDPPKLASPCHQASGTRRSSDFEEATSGEALPGPCDAESALGDRWEEVACIFELLDHPDVAE